MRTFKTSARDPARDPARGSATERAKDGTKDTAKARGERAEARALAYLQGQGLALVVRNYRCKGGELDLVMRAPDGTLVFVEVRSRSSDAFGGALASITTTKRQRILQAANHYLATLDHAPRCRLDVVAIGPRRLEWLRDAFGAGEPE
ncbi:YraN family protein [Cupriavidus gilardii]|uniref:YraN family protein n=1 Tax=Cupriavidus gilardii TaxID=82541 RepID=UPI0021B40B00|nr:YraN family protein [Cupriavidus gilardii]UXC36172.1 YraN family protein [Cupriavidus gilardii]